MGNTQQYLFKPAVWAGYNPIQSKGREKFLAFSGCADSVARMIQGGFPGEEDRGSS
jgi:hypothetical protein